MHMKREKLVFFLTSCMTATATVLCCHERKRKLYFWQKIQERNFTLYKIKYEEKETFHQKASLKNTWDQNPSFCSVTSSTNGTASVGVVFAKVNQSSLI